MCACVSGWAGVGRALVVCMCVCGRNACVRLCVTPTQVSVLGSNSRMNASPATHTRPRMITTVCVYVCVCVCVCMHAFNVCLCLCLRACVFVCFLLLPVYVAARTKASLFLCGFMPCIGMIWVYEKCECVMVHDECACFPFSWRFFFQQQHSLLRACG